MERSETTVTTESWLSTISFKSEAGVWLVTPSTGVDVFSDEYLGDNQCKVMTRGSIYAPQPCYKR